MDLDTGLALEITTHGRLTFQYSILVYTVGILTYARGMTGIDSTLPETLILLYITHPRVLHWLHTCWLRPASFQLQPL